MGKFVVYKKKKKKFSLISFFKEYKKLFFIFFIFLVLPVTVVASLSKQNIFTNAYQNIPSIPYRIMDGKLITIPVGTPTTMTAARYTGMHVGVVSSNVYISATASLQQLPNSLQTIPNAYSLPKAYNAPVWNQGNLGSCIEWAIDHYLLGWYMKKYNVYPPAGGLGDPNRLGGFSPMFVYSQVSKHCGVTTNNPNGYLCSLQQCVSDSSCGTNVQDALNVLTTKGVLPRDEYYQGDYDAKDLPTSTEMQVAKRYILPSTSSNNLIWWLFGSHNQSHNLNITHGSEEDNIKRIIEIIISSGNPIVIMMPVYDNWLNNRVTPNNFFIDMPKSGDSWQGEHALFAYAYDSNGVWVLNSWGSNWGINGAAEISWNYITTLATDSLKINVPILPAPLPTAPPNACTNANGKCINIEATLGKNKYECPTFNGVAYTQTTDKNADAENKGCEKAISGTVCCVPKNSNTNGLSDTKVSVSPSASQSLSTNSFSSYSVSSSQKYTCLNIQGQKCVPEIYYEKYQCGNNYTNGSGTCQPEANGGEEVCCKPKPQPTQPSTGGGGGGGGKFL